jgi:hypothetical protein
LCVEKLTEYPEQFFLTKTHRTDGAVRTRLVMDGGVTHNTVIFIVGGGSSFSPHHKPQPPSLTSSPNADPSEGFFEALWRRQCSV